ncbi:MAG: glutaredoxin 3 [Betaproteobacteria bacterium]|nr:glutaredoxin 3 [Betaproteobacteria bacterium]
MSEAAAMPIPPVKMYTTAVCPYCQRAEQLLRARGVVDIEKIRIDLDPALLDEMMRITGRRTVPQIFIGDYHVGGCDDLQALDSEGRLTALLGG